MGRKGPEAPPNPMAPFRVAPPTYVFLNNHYCWPLFRPGGGSSSNAAATAAAGASAALGVTGKPGSGGQPQQRMVTAAVPKLAATEQPRLVQVEYLPVEFAASADDSALFAKTVTQFYFK